MVGDSMFKTMELDTRTFELLPRGKLRFPRHGHSVCPLGDKFIICTGSRKEIDSAQSKCEQYNINLDLWFDIADLNEGRHYHASCSFRERYVYVFCGIANSTKKYVNSVERYDSMARTPWEMINFTSDQLPARQGLGVAQMN